MKDNAGRLRIGDDNTGHGDGGGVANQHGVDKRRANSSSHRPCLTDGDVTGRQAIVIGAWCSRT